MNIPFSAPCPASHRRFRSHAKAAPVRAGQQPLQPGLSPREREMLTLAVRVAEAIRLGLDPEGFDPAAGLPPRAREAARRAETQLRRRELSQMQGQPLVLTALSGSLLLTRSRAFPPRVTEELRQAVGKVFGQLHLQRLQA